MSTRVDKCCLLGGALMTEKKREGRIAQDLADNRTRRWPLLCPPRAAPGGAHKLDPA